MKHLLLTTIAAVVLVGCGGPSVDIWNAARDGNIETVKQHLAAGEDVNAKGYDGWTPLHFAAYNGRKEIAELLITKGADVNAPLGDGLTPLDGVIIWLGGNMPNSPSFRNQTEIAALLRKHGGKTGEELKAEGK
jgi:hypothetical protein